MTQFIEKSQIIKIATFERNQDLTVREAVAEFLDYELTRIEKNPYGTCEILIAIDSNDVDAGETELRCWKFWCPNCHQANYEVHYWDNATAMAACQHCDADLEW